MTFIWETKRLGTITVPNEAYAQMKGRISLNVAAMNAIGPGAGRDGKRWLSEHTLSMLGREEDIPKLTLADMFALICALGKNVGASGVDEEDIRGLGGYVFHPDHEVYEDVIWEK